MLVWRTVTDYSPIDGELPVIVVRSLERDHAVWTPWFEAGDKLTDEQKAGCSQFFDDGEQVTSEEWYAKPS